MRISLGHLLDPQRGHLFPWAPVLFGCGIGTYFALPFEPNAMVWTSVGAGLALALLIRRRCGEAAGLSLTALALALAGFAVAGEKTHRVGPTTLGSRYYGPVEGRIVAIDRSISDAIRLTLDQVVLKDRARSRTPERVRIALHGDQRHFRPEPGVTVILTGHLSPPGGAVEPGGFDFRRHAWFLGLGAVGYTRTPVLALLPHQGRSPALWVYRLRMRVSSAVQAALPGRAGAFAAAITTGDRSGMDNQTLAALRASNLAHLLAISGLHMGLLTGFVFAAFRVGIALVPGAALRLPAKKIAAIGALAAGAIYLGLSGGNVATERAFVMVAVMFTATLFDRRAITLRAVSVAALIILALRPEALVGPGFQMSFAATAALVAVYAGFRERDTGRNRWPRWATILGGVALSSLVAGLATAPFGAAHFNQVPHYGLLANVVSVPLMGAVIIPGAVLAAVLVPFGYGWIGLWLMEPAILWILAVAETISGWDGAVSLTVAPPAAVLPLVGLGGLWLVIWQGRGRLGGLAPLAASLALWAGAERPEVLVSQSGGLVGVMTDEGRALSKPKGEGFAAEIWLENDGDGAGQPEAHARRAFETQGRMRVFRLGEARLLHATGKQAASAALARCSEVALVIVNVRAPAPEGCLVYDSVKLNETGALAIGSGPAGPVVVTARQKTGRRLWSQ